MKGIIAAVLLLLAWPAYSRAADGDTGNATAGSDGVLNPNLKFGLYIHFGVATFARPGEMGEVPAARFAPTGMDVRSWVHAAKQAGMSFAILTAKHISGFCLWASPGYDYDVASSPYKGDIIADFIVACKAEDIVPGVHYSIPDAHNFTLRGRTVAPPLYFNLIKKQITELFTAYPGMRIMTFDGAGHLSPDQYNELRVLILQLDPQCMFLDSAHDPQLASASIIKGWMWSPQGELNAAQQLYGQYYQAMAAGKPFALGVGPDTTGVIPADQMGTLMQVKDLIAQGEPPAGAGAPATSPVAPASAPSQPATPVTPNDLKRGLILYYNFDTKPVDGKIPDLSGQKNDGQATGVDWVPNGHRGGSVSFGLNDSYITVPNNDGLNPPRLTLAAWIKTSFKDPVWRRIFDKETNTGYDLTMGGGGSDLPGNTRSFQGQFCLEVGQGGGARSGVEVTDGRWHLVAGTFDGTKLQVYVDGLECGKGAPAKGNPGVNAYDLTIGANRSNPNAKFGEVGASFNGSMDDVMMWNRALSADEVQALYHFRRTPADADAALVPAP